MPLLWAGELEFAYRWRAVCSPGPRPSRHEDYSCHRDVLGVWPFRQGSLIHSGIEYAGREPLLSPTTNMHRHAQPMAGRKTVPGAEVTPEDTK